MCFGVSINALAHILQTPKGEGGGAKKGLFRELYVPEYGLHLRSATDLSPSWSSDPELRICIERRKVGQARRVFPGLLRSQTVFADSIEGPRLNR